MGGEPAFGSRGEEAPQAVVLSMKRPFALGWQKCSCQEIHDHV
jgi:hypothetical protein